MLLLALDTCDAKGSVALLRDAEVLGVSAHETSDDYSVWLLPTIARVLAVAGVTFPEVDVYAAAAGPGSFTGVRVGLTTLKAWAEVTGKPIVSVSRLEALGSLADGGSRWVAAFTNAHRNQVYGSIYERENGALLRAGDEAVMAAGAFVAWVSETVQGQAVRWISTEPQMVSETEEWAARQSDCKGVPQRVQEVEPVLAPAIGRLGFRLAQQKRFTDALALDANYVRRSDAEVAWTDRHAARQNK
jgi:tRNA threonylcarbamoyl adenosine modification protein YeaZ